MRSTRLTMSLLVLCAAGCAARSAAPQSAHAAPPPPAAPASPPPPMAPAATAAAEPEAPPTPLSRHATVPLFKKRDPTAIRDALARLGSLYLTHGADVTAPAAPTSAAADAPAEGGAAPL